MRIANSKIHLHKGLMVYLLLLLEGFAVLASVGPPVKVDLLGDPRPPVAGEPFQGVLEIISAYPAALSDVRLEGVGWSVVSLETIGVPPPELPPDELGAYQVEFVAVPGDPALPLKYTLLFGDHLFQGLLDLSPERSERLTRPGRLVQPPASRMGMGLPGGGEVLAPGGGDARSIRLHGRLVYFRKDGQKVGVDGATIEIFDDEPGPVSDELDEGHTHRTKSDGSFNITFTWDPCFLCDRDPDLYLRFVSRNQYVVVEGKDLFDYKWTTETVSDFEGSTLDFGELQVVDNAPACHILTNITRAARWLGENAGMSLPKVDVKWPSLFHPHYQWTFQDIQINSEYQWDEGTIVHEYGHHWMFHRSDFERDLGICGTDGSYCNGIGDACPDNTCPCTFCGHRDWCAESAIVAWQEGWPDWFSDAVTRSFQARYGLAPQFRDDYEALGSPAPAGCSQSPASTEGFVAALLRDIEDANNENDSYPVAAGPGDCLSMGPRPIFTIATQDKPLSATSFLSRFLERYPAYQKQLWATALNCGFFSVEFPPPETLVDSFEDRFAGPDGAPAGWTPMSGLWRRKSEGLVVDTGVWDEYPIYSPPRAVSRFPDSLDVFGYNLLAPWNDGNLIYFAWTNGAGWQPHNLTKEWSKIGDTFGTSSPPLVLKRGQTLEVFGVGQTSSPRSFTDLIHYQGPIADRWMAENVTALPRVGSKFRLQADAPLVGMSRDVDSLDVFGWKLQSPGDLIAYRWTKGTGWEAKDLSVLLTGLEGTPAAVSRAADSLDLLARNREGDLVRFLWTAAGGWTGENVTAGLNVAPPLTAAEFQIKEGPVCVSRDGRTLDAFGVTVPGDVFRQPGQLIHYRWSPEQGWEAENLSTSQLKDVLGAAPVSGPLVISRSIDSLDVLVHMQTGFDLLPLTWSERGGWSAGVTPGGGVFPLSVLSRTADSLDTIGQDGAGVIHSAWTQEGGWQRGVRVPMGNQPGFKVQYPVALSRASNSLDVFAVSSPPRPELYHGSWSPESGWAGENVTGGHAGQEAWIWAGSPVKAFGDLRSLEFRFEFLEKPPDAIGRHGGVFCCAQATTPVATGNSGYNIQWRDGPGAPAYSISLWDCGTEEVLGTAAGSADPGVPWRLEFSGPDIRLLVDGGLKLSVRDSTYRSGHICFWCDGNGQHLRVDDVRINAAEPPPGVPFHRGEANADGDVDISDSVFILSWLFLGGSDPSCLEAADVNDDGAVDLSDAVNLLQWLYLGGPPPAAPGVPPAPCGSDRPGSPDLGCKASPRCG